MNMFDLTPDPKVLIALTHTPMKPLDALCELIDNAIDSFQAAALQGQPVEHPLVAIQLPARSELNKNSGIIQVRDNGVGLKAEMAEKAIRAGFSGNNPYDSLGLFGMGFNISTGKLGRKTRFVTATSASEKAIEVTIDLEKMQEQGSYSVPFEEYDKPFNQGTLVEISEWWPEGNANSSFVKKLIQYGMPKIRAEIGRRYATMLRSTNNQAIGKIKIEVNGETCVPYEHCVWSEKRFVERQGHGQIPAVINIDHIVGTQKRCSDCTAIVPVDKSSCVECDSGQYRTIEERISGWVGIQRFDNNTNYGIDLIRNGRTIRIGEKSAFFEFEDDLNRVIKDYPIDSQYGRIVGEIHLNHVPVDFTKQDFQRSSPEWQRAMNYLRGESSLQPTQPNAYWNDSPVYRLYQGYRRVRKFGKGDMYMGYWDEETSKPTRISRDIEKDYYQKFLEKVPGYYDDEEWWKHVEEADKAPAGGIISCPDCDADNLESAEACFACDYIFIGKTCVNADCAMKLVKSAQACPHCGTSQAIQVQVPWTCQVCGARNIAAATTCIECGQAIGTVNTLSRDYLYEHSNKSDDLSIPGCSVLLSDGSFSTPVDVIAYITDNPIRHNLESQNTLPVAAFKDPDRLEIFVDKGHRLFKSFAIKPEQMIAAEVALFLYDSHRSLSGDLRHSLAHLEWAVIESRWADKLETTKNQTKEECEKFFLTVKQRIVGIMPEKHKDIFDDMTEEESKAMIDNIYDHDKEDYSNIEELKASGRYLLFINEQTVLNIFKKYTAHFFDGGLWELPFENIDGLNDESLINIQERIRTNYLNCLETIVLFMKHPTQETLVLRRVNLALDYLLQKVVQL